MLCSCHSHHTYFNPMFIPESDEMLKKDIEKGIISPRHSVYDEMLKKDIEKGIISPRHSVYDDKSMGLFCAKFDKPTWSEWIKSRWFSLIK